MPKGVGGALSVLLSLALVRAPKSNRQGCNNFPELDSSFAHPRVPKDAGFCPFNPQSHRISTPLVLKRFGPSSSQNTAKMSFGGQTPTIIVLKEGTQTQIYPTVAAHRCPPSNEATDTRSLTKVGLQEPTPLRAKARLSPTSTPVWRSKPPSSRRWAPMVVTC